MIDFYKSRYRIKLAAFLMCAAAAAVIGGCSMSAGQNENVSAKETITVEESLESTLIEDDQQTFYIYITTDGMNFVRYPYEGEEVSPEKLIEAIAQKTGWRLTLSDAVTDGKGGLTVSFSKECSIFSDNTEGQTEEFKVDHQKDMIAAVLGSVQKTLQYYASPTDPDNVDIYFTGEDDTPIQIEGIIDLPLEEPYAYEYWH